MDIIVLIFLARDLGRIAKSKGLRASTWQIYLVVSWIVMEIVGIVVGLSIFGKNNLISVALVTLGFALASYFTLRSVLFKFPDRSDEDIDNIGR